MIITIDGPAGAGKSSAAKMLANRLGFQFLDTGAMYRAVTWAALQRNLLLSDQAALGELAAQLQIAFLGDTVLVNGRDVTEAIRTPAVTCKVVSIADTPSVRARLVRLQREIAKHGNYVCEGRDQGSVVFPQAICKFYLTASCHERAVRRVAQLRKAGQEAVLEEIIEQQDRRDQQDYNRPVGKLIKAEGAIEINTDHKTIGEVVDELETIALLRIRQLTTASQK